MSSETARVLPGDTLTVTIKGTVLDPSGPSTAGGTSLKIYRPSRASLFEARFLPADVRRGIRIESLLGEDVEIQYEITSQFKNGVHIDANGRYWMRRPDGWHEMSVTEQPVSTILGAFVPPGITRLKEAKD